MHQMANAIHSVVQTAGPEMIVKDPSVQMICVDQKALVSSQMNVFAQNYGARLKTVGAIVCVCPV
jgi:hypothetical protein